MLESEAKTKWCPMARSAAPINNQSYGPAANRFHDTGGKGEGDLQPYALCYGSQCMMWRKLTENVLGHEIETNEGYCGLAGN